MGEVTNFLQSLFGKPFSRKNFDFSCSIATNQLYVKYHYIFQKISPFVYLTDHISALYFSSWTSWSSCEMSPFENATCGGNATRWKTKECIRTKSEIASGKSCKYQPYQVETCDVYCPGEKQLYETMVSLMFVRTVQATRFIKNKITKSFLSLTSFIFCFVLCLILYCFLFVCFCFLFSFYFVDAQLVDLSKA